MSSCVVGAVLFPGILNFCFPNVDVSLVYARNLLFSVTYKIFNENCLIKYKECSIKKRECSKHKISSARHSRNTLFRKLSKKNEQKESAIGEMKFCGSFI